MKSVRWFDRLLVLYLWMSLLWKLKLICGKAVLGLSLDVGKFLKSIYTDKLSRQLTFHNPQFDILSQCCHHRAKIMEYVNYVSVTYSIGLHVFCNKFVRQKVGYKFRMSVISDYFCKLLTVTKYSVACTTLEREHSISETD